MKWVKCPIMKSLEEEDESKSSCYAKTAAPLLYGIDPFDQLFFLKRREERSYREVARSSSKGICSSKGLSQVRMRCDLKSQPRSNAPGNNALNFFPGTADSCLPIYPGEISIQDKEPGEKGTCFKFNAARLSSGGGGSSSRYK